MTAPIRRAAYNRVPERAFFAGQSIEHDLAGSILVEGVITRLYRRADENHWHPWTGRLARRSCLHRLITQSDKSVSRQLWGAIMDALIEEGLVAEEKNQAGEVVSLTVHSPSRLKVAPRGVIEGLITSQEAERISKKANNETVEEDPKTDPDRAPDQAPRLTRLPHAQQTADRRPQIPEIKPQPPQNDLIETVNVETRGSSTSHPTPTPTPDPEPDLDPGPDLRVFEGGVDSEPGAGGPWSRPTAAAGFLAGWREACPTLGYAPALHGKEQRAERGLAELLNREGITPEALHAFTVDYLHDHAAGRAFPKPKDGRRQWTGLPQFLAVLKRQLRPPARASPPVTVSTPASDPTPEPNRMPAAIATQLNAWSATVQRISDPVLRPRPAPAVEAWCRDHSPEHTALIEMFCGSPQRDAETPLQRSTTPPAVHAANG
jgi:hypothetical protein